MNRRLIGAAAGAFRPAGVAGSGYSAGVPRRRRGVCLAAVVAAVLAAWTKQAPATSPPARFRASMDYDAATGNMVLFGGAGGNRVLNDTWVWGPG